MPLIEDLKRIGEKLTGAKRPKPEEVRALVRKREADARKFRDDGETPNNPELPFIHYHSPVLLDDAFDPAAIFEELFASNGWEGSWRDGVYDFNHFHTRTHEVLGIARGHARVRFGGERGRIITLKAGDVVILPAGTGHRRISASRDLLVVGAYPDNGGKYDEPQPDDVDVEQARADIAKVKMPKRDPVYGAKAGLRLVWRNRE
jgi:uncharacterized protein YjlB